MHLAVPSTGVHVLGAIFEQEVSHERRAGNLTRETYESFMRALRERAQEKRQALAWLRADAAQQAQEVEEYCGKQLAANVEKAFTAAVTGLLVRFESDDFEMNQPLAAQVREEVEQRLIHDDGWHAEQAREAAALRVPIANWKHAPPEDWRERFI